MTAPLDHAPGARLPRSRAPWRLVPHVQPIVTLTTGTVSGYEALARFPDTSIPVTTVFEKAWADGFGAAMEAAALTAALTLPDRPSAAYLAVNVSPRAFAAAAVTDALDVDLSGVVVELTEAHYVPTAQLKRTAAWLRERGGRVAIDDVGTGYAGLERIISLAPDLIKLDRSLVVQLADDRVCRAMVESLVRFAAGCGTSVCAEGIETHEQLQVVAELDIALGQGFLFGHAQPTWTRPPKHAVEAATEVHRQALNATPKQSLFLGEHVLLERLADRFSEAEELEDVHYAVSGLTSLLQADEVAVSLVDPAADRLVTINHQTWAAADGDYPLAQYPTTRWALDTRRAVQVLATDPDAEASEVARLEELGHACLLMVPVTTQGRTVGLLRFYRARPVAWSLTHIRLARIGASQLAATLDRLLLRDHGGPLGRPG